MFKPSSNFLTDHSKAVDLFCYLCFVFVFAILSYLFLAALWSPAMKGSTYVFLCSCHFPIQCPGSGVVLDCIDSDLCFGVKLARFCHK